VTTESKPIRYWLVPHLWIIRPLFAKYPGGGKVKPNRSRTIPEPVANMGRTRGEQKAFYSYLSPLQILAEKAPVCRTTLM